MGLFLFYIYATKTKTMKRIYILFALLIAVGAQAQIINIPDANFKAKLVSANTNNSVARGLTGIANIKIDTNNNGEIEQSEALLVGSLQINNADIGDLTGIASFTNLFSLWCSQNDLTTLNLTNLAQLATLICDTNPLTTLNINGLSQLQWIDANGCELSTLNLSGLTGLKTLRIHGNNFTTMHISGLPALLELGCESNQITALSITGSPQIQSLYCRNNLLTTLNVSANTSLREVWCSNNQLTSLNVNGLINCYSLYCENNQLTTLDLNSLRALDTLLAENNNLTSLFVKNGISESATLYSNPNLAYVCCDEAEVDSYIDNVPATCEVNTYCTFTPAGTYYTISGTQTWDSNNNGCDNFDGLMPYLRIDKKTTSGNLVGSYLSNNSGEHAIVTQSGTYVYTPVLEFPAYFNITPSTSTITLPGSSTWLPYCITSNGAHPDLEVSIIPLDAARPGFNSNYKIICRNKGNVGITGMVQFTFNDAVLDFVSATPAATQTTGNLSWNFLNLKPFQTNEMLVMLNSNSPVETPAVNINDVFPFSASVTFPQTDETPTDNSFVFNQTVVGSYDPNDKTCVQGTTIAPTMVGKYVNYVIRFENTGTFAAQHVIVKDLIDTAKFDVATLIPLSASHNFSTKITGNKVEFIFQNINLPFDDFNNDGYIAFKIKTKPTLVVGDSFSNAASIYFDYNHPIVTDPAVTTISVLETKDFEFSDYLSIYPNPTDGVLNIQSKNNLEISSAEIYNALGQLVMAITQTGEVAKIDVSQLGSGNYFIRIHSDKGTTNAKFAKK